MDDDELGLRLAAANPARTPRGAQLTAADYAIRDRIMQSSTRSRSRTIRMRSIAVSAFAVAAAVTIALVVVLAPRQTASAGSPPPITFSGGGTLSEVVAGADARLAGVPGPTVPTREVDQVQWAFSVEVDQKRSIVVPQVTHLKWNADGSGSIVSRALKPPSSDDVPDDTGRAPDEGDIVWQLTFKPGDFTSPVVQPPGETVDDVQTMLHAYNMPASPTSGDVVQAVSAAFDMWTLTNRQHGEILQLLLHTDGVKVLGVGKDRLGRKVVGLQVESPTPGVRDTLLVSASTGRIVGLESTRVTSDRILPAGAVMSYRMWDSDIKDADIKKEK